VEGSSGNRTVKRLKEGPIMRIRSDIPSKTSSPQNSTPEGRGVRRIVNPLRCRLWTQHSRPEEQLTSAACSALRESIAKNGQHQAALGRPVSDDPGCDIEIICGARRHVVACALGRDFLVEVRPMTDAEAYVALYEENLLREGDSPYVRGQLLSRALRSGTYQSQEELAHAFSLSHSRVSRLLMVAQLPSVIVASFHTQRDIRECWGVQLYQLWKQSDLGHTLTNRARSLASRQPRPPANEVYETLIAGSEGKSPKRRSNRSIAVRGSNGLILFREENQTADITFAVPKAILSPKRHDAIRQAMIRILETSNAEIP
jgi:ParB family chromosome partitioning protein